MNRRSVLGLAGAGFAVLLGGCRASEAKVRYPIERSDAEWRRRLSPQAFRVLREADTEPAGSSALDREKRAGTFVCAGCANPVFASKDKFDSGTGWPSFIRPLAGRVGTKPDRSLFFMPRTECHCARCGGHLGHVFDDGPPPTGQRWCINGVAMRFVPARG